MKEFESTIFSYDYWISLFLYVLGTRLLGILRDTDLIYLSVSSRRNWKSTSL